MSDGELVRQTLAGRTLAYEELVRRWAGRITALCHAKVRRAEAAEDLAQETLMRGFRALATLVDPEKFGTWLYGIAIRACLDYLKARERSTVPFSALGISNDSDALLSDRLAASRSAECDLDRAEEIEHLMAEVEALPDDYRDVVLLYYYQDVTYRDLAEILGVSSATINARLTKARALLRQRLSSLGR